MHKVVMNTVLTEMQTKDVTQTKEIMGKWTEDVWLVELSEALDVGVKAVLGIQF
jgi:hypothetical protein